ELQREVQALKQQLSGLTAGARPTAPPVPQAATVSEAPVPPYPAAPAPPALPPPPAPLAPPAPTPETLETRIGSRWLLYIGVAAIVLGASYFVKYAFDN